jgi:predicted HD phosphohydrolase
LNNPHSASWEHVNLAAQIADLKNDHYRLLLTVSAMLELLLSKGAITREEFMQKAAELDQTPAADADAITAASLHPMG